MRIDLLYGENRDIWGLDLGLVNIVTREMLGSQIGLANINLGEMAGVQIGIDNIIGNMPALASSSLKNATAYGLQLGALNVVYPDRMIIGAQVGLINVADKMQGLQIGIINCANDLTGVQIGLLNYNEAAEFYMAPIINTCF